MKRFLGVACALLILFVNAPMAFAMVFSITHRCVNFIKASCYSI